MTSKPLLFQNDYLTSVELCSANAPYENLQKGELSFMHKYRKQLR